MARLHLQVSKAIEEAVKRRARARGMSVSSYLAELVQRQIADNWPEDFFTDVVGGWAGEPLTRPADLMLEEREGS